MKNIIFPDYNKCLMNISTSIIKHYGAGTKFSTLPILDNELDKDYRNVVVILVDAMGSEILKKHQN
ncbi:MAG: nucleotide pyrophosphatase, partial [Tenericutes bacterium]|nr:nucleotide pyrophosphatase [Mycoplasmatota bacterium]